MVYELIGYLASVLIALSLLMVNIVRLRVINLLGCLAFVTYGVLIHSMPIVISNGFILIINIYYLKKLFGHNLESFTYLPLGEYRKTQVHDFLDAYTDDIHLHFPLFSKQKLEPAFGGDGRIYLAVKHLKPVGLAAVIPLDKLIFDPEGEEKQIGDFFHKELFSESTACVLIDYIQKKYRNIGVDKKMYTLMLRDLSPNIRFIVAIGEISNRGNDRYLKKNGHRIIRTFSRYAVYLKTRPE